MSDAELTLQKFSDVTTPEQRYNLRKLANYLKALPQDYSHFAMRTYAGMSTAFDCDSFDDPAREIDTNVCATVACALGHGPLAGIKPLREETWTQYGARVFVPENSPTDEYWEWFFSAHWEPVDNTPHGAAARIEWVLENDTLPENWYDQRNGYEPPCYKA